MKHLFTILFTTIAISAYSGYSNTDRPKATRDSHIPAFPGAEGFRSFTSHGRGGKVIEVTNLKDHGHGSLRDAIEAKGKRIIVFRVGGMIELESKLTIYEPYCMIAGQTAPGDGICIKNASLNIATHDVVIRYLRVRPGDGPGDDPEDRDCLEVFPLPAREHGYAPKAYNIVIDHCSFSWGIDENVSFYGILYPDPEVEVRDITMQWCIVTEGLSKSLHPKGPHSKGVLVAGGAHQISMHHNLLAHNVERHPLYKTGTNGNFINNILYNEPWGVMLVDEDYNASHPHPTSVDIIGNYVKEGPNTKGMGYVLNLQERYLQQPAKFYLKGNICPYRKLPYQDEWDAATLTGLDLNNIKAPEPTLFSPDIKATSASKAYEEVLWNSGCDFPIRDQVDSRIAMDVLTGKGSFINSPDEAGGYPLYRNGEAPPDKDRDGMPDEWEKKHGDLTPGGYDLDKNYTNIEVYLNNLISFPQNESTAETYKVKSKLQLIIDKILEENIDGIVSTLSGDIYTDYSNLPPGDDMNVASPYRQWYYWNGVLNIAMMKMYEQSREEKYLNYTLNNYRFVFDNYETLKKLNDAGQLRGLELLWRMQLLDHVGAMGAGLAEAYKFEKRKDYFDYLELGSDYIINKELKLKDGTLSWDFPYKNTLWLDDLYMSVPMIARMGELTGDKKYFDFAAKQVKQFTAYLFSERTRLYYHYYYGDLNRQGVAHWGRANGWSIMAQADLLERIPEDHPDRNDLLRIFRQQILGFAMYQSESGLWHQILDRKDSYLETSCTAMFTYAVAKGINEGWLEPRYKEIAINGWKGIESMITEEGDVKNICVGTGTSSSMVHYYTRPVELNDIHGLGAVIMAGIEVNKMSDTF